MLAMKARVNQQANQSGVPSYLMNRAQNTEMNPAGSTVITNLRVDKLVPYKSHPFKLYEGMRFSDMVESIRTNGVMLPIIVRPIDGSTYEILSGHNRVNAAKAAGLDTVPAIVREGLTDDEALFIVTETNLIQRSFADLLHSERALIISTHYDAIKRQGRRTDLINDIEKALKAFNINVSEDLAPVATRVNSAELIGEKYGLSHDNVVRYIRINKLIDEIKERIDNNEIAIRSGVSLSYLPENEQEMIEDVLGDGNYKLDMNKAEYLRIASEKKPLTHETVEEILVGTKKPRRVTAGFKLQPKIVSKYFKPDQKKADIENTIIKALEYYFLHYKTAQAEDTAAEEIPEMEDRESS